MCTGSNVPPSMPIRRARNAWVGPDAAGSTTAFARPSACCSGTAKSGRLLSAKLTVTDHDVLLAGQAFQTDRAAGVQLISRNADLGTQSVFETIGEAGRGVDHHRTGVDLGHEAPGLPLMFGNDGVAVVRAIVVDVFDGFIQPGHDADRQDRRQILGVPVFFGRCNGLDQIAGALTTAQLDALFPELCSHWRQEVSGNGLIDQQGFHRAADTVTVGLGVERNTLCLGQVGVGTDVNVADTVQVLDDRHPGIATDTLDQALASTWNDDVHILGHGDQGANGARSVVSTTCTTAAANRLRPDRSARRWQWRDWNEWLRSRRAKWSRYRTSGTGSPHRWSRSDATRR